MCSAPSRSSRVFLINHTTPHSCSCSIERQNGTRLRSCGCTQERLSICSKVARSTWAIRCARFAIPPSPNSTVTLPREARKSPSAGGKEATELKHVQISLTWRLWCNTALWLYRFTLYAMCQWIFASPRVLVDLGVSTSRSQTLLRVNEPTRGDEENRKALPSRGSAPPAGLGLRRLRCQAEPIPHTFRATSPCLGVSKRPGAAPYVCPGTSQ